jgi:hypothetical protein
MRSLTNGREGLEKGIAKKMQKPEPAKVFEDRLTAGDWRVEWEDEDGGVEVTIFSGPSARERAIQYADWRYRQFVERTWPST